MLADCRETAVVIPLVVVVVEVQVTLVAIEVEIRHVTVVVQLTGGTVNRARYHLLHHPLNTLRVVSVYGIFNSLAIPHQVSSIFKLLC